MKNPNQDLEAAVAEARGKLVQQGLTFVDKRKINIHDPLERNLAVKATVEVSLELLESDERTRYTDLAVFPEDRPVPFAAIARLWNATDNLQTSDAERLFGHLAELSLVVEGFEPDGTRTAYLHRVLRQYLLDLLPDPTALHRSLLTRVATTAFKSKTPTARDVNGG